MKIRDKPHCARCGLLEPVRWFTVWEEDAEGKTLRRMSNIPYGPHCVPTRADHAWLERTMENGGLL